MKVLLWIAARIRQRMQGETGSATIHYKDGVAKRIEYRFFEDVPSEAELKDEKAA